MFCSSSLEQDLQERMDKLRRGLSSSTSSSASSSSFRFSFVCSLSRFFCNAPRRAGLGVLSHVFCGSGSKWYVAATIRRMLKNIGHFAEYSSLL